VHVAQSDGELRALADLAALLLGGSELLDGIFWPFLIPRLRCKRARIVDRGIQFLPAI
jgi:hypothetical protein